MKRNTLLPVLVATLLLTFTLSLSSYAQPNTGKCSASILALNVPPPTRTNGVGAFKKPCKKEGKKIEQSATLKSDRELRPYDNIPFDQLEQPFINIYPEVNSTCDQEKDQHKPPTVCKTQPKKEVEPQPETPKRPRPSATVKLVKL